MPRKEALQTYHALQASQLAAAVHEALKRTHLPPGDYSAELTEPQGPSTAGGVQAMQHVRLLPGLTGYPTLVIGHANQSDKKAELRTYEYLDAVHRRRYRRPIALDRPAYEQLVPVIRGLLEALHFQTTIVGPPEDVADDPRRASGVRRTLAAGGLVAALALIGWALWKMLAR